LVTYDTRSDYLQAMCQSRPLAFLRIPYENRADSDGLRLTQIDMIG